MVCRSCGHKQLEVPPQGLKIPPKILYLDIETALMNVYIYDLKVKGYINKRYIKENSFVINWAAAWLDKDYRYTHIMTAVVTPEEARNRDDKRIIERIWSLMEKADYIAGHNSDRFDIKVLKWRFLVNDMGFPRESKRLDSFKLSGKETRPPSRGLEYLATTLGYNGKRGLCDEEWMTIVNDKTDDDTKAKLLRKANRYCRGDVAEGVNTLRRYAKAIESSGRVLVR